MKRVVITGIGIHSCLGTNLNEVTESLRAGKSGIVYDQDRKDFGYRSPLTGMVESPNLKKQLSRRERISLGDEGAYAYVATMEALENAKLTQEYIDKNEVGNMLGSDKYYSGKYWQDAAHLHPLNYALGLASAAEKAGVKIYENSRVTNYQAGKNAQVVTNKGFIKTNLLTFCNTCG